MQVDNCSEQYGLWASYLIANSCSIDQPSGMNTNMAILQRLLLFDIKWRWGCNVLVNDADEIGPAVLLVLARCCLPRTPVRRASKHALHLIVLIALQARVLQAHVQGVVAQALIVRAHVQHAGQHPRGVEARRRDIQIQLACALVAQDRGSGTVKIAQAILGAD